MTETGLLNNELIGLAKRHFVLEWLYMSLAAIRLTPLPETIEIKGYVLHRKSEFHITLFSGEDVAKLIDSDRIIQLEAELVAHFASYVTRCDLIDYILLKQFRFVERAERKSLIIMANVPGLPGLFAELSKAISGNTACSACAYYPLHAATR